jgi:hypothetical protein
MFGEGSGGELILGAEVWPTHVGVTTEHPGNSKWAATEPSYHLDYIRGQIEWIAVSDSGPVGKAKIHVPPGLYTYMVYLHGPGSLPMMCGSRQLSHPVLFETSGVIDIENINYGDWKSQPAMR